MNLVWYFTVFLVVLVDLVEFLRAQCVYPTSLRDHTWFHHYDQFSPEFKWVYKFLQNGNTEMEYTDTSIPFSIAYVCTSLSEPNAENLYIVRHFQVAPTHIQCQRLIKGSGTYLERLTKIDTQSTTATSCPTLYSGTEDYTVIVKDPFSFTGTTCPFSEGTYHAKVSTSANGPDQCALDQSSTVTVTGNRMNVSTCVSSSNTYETPFSIDLTCVDTYSQATVGGANGDILILATEIGGSTRFYCAMYVIDNGRIFLSFNLNGMTTTKCVPSASYNTYGTFNGNEYAAFSLEDMLTTTPEPSTATASTIVTTTTPASTSTVVTSPSTPTSSSSSTTQSSTPAGTSTPPPTPRPTDSAGNPLPLGRCSSNPCVSNHTDGCNDVYGQYYWCRCKRGYSGPNCTDVDHCLLLSPCLNDGTCQPALTAPFYECVCTDDWTGQLCQDEVEFRMARLSSDMTTLLILVIVLAVVLFLAVATAICACHWNRRRQEDSRPASVINAPIISNMEADSYSSMRSWHQLYRDGTGSNKS